MNWMLLPPSANAGRRIDDKDVSDGNAWAGYLHAGMDFCRQMVGGAGTAQASRDPSEPAPPEKR